MYPTSEFAVIALVLGVGATVVIDVWAIVRWRLFNVAVPDYGLVGRWLGHMPRGRFRHERIAVAAPVRGERALGWIAHYAIGVAFAALLLMTQGREWIDHPTLGPALIVGVGTVAAPFLLMQPGMGAGLAARHTPRPVAARLQSLITH